MLINDRKHIHNKTITFSGIIVLMLLCLNVIIAKHAFLNHKTMYPVLLVTLPLLLISAVYHWYHKTTIH